MFGTVGGLGTWLALALKSGFALLGMGAYLAITPYVQDLLPVSETATLWSIKLLAVVLTLVFMFVNLFGAKETTRLQGVLVITLLGVLAFFVVQGLWHVYAEVPREDLRRQYTPFLHTENGWRGLASTIGLVFVSYAGLTKVASVSEEVKKPDRNLPLGMFLSLLTATIVYVVGVFIIVAVLNPDSLQTVTGYVEPSIKDKAAGWRCQFERTGYFILDPDTTPERLVFNRTVTLRDSRPKKNG